MLNFRLGYAGADVARFQESDVDQGDEGASGLRHAPPCCQVQWLDGRPLIECYGTPGSRLVSTTVGALQAGLPGRDGFQILAELAEELGKSLSDC